VPDGLRLALTTLTVARVRRPRQLDRRTAGSAMSLAPLVGLLLGLCAAGLVFLVRYFSGQSLMSAVVGVTVLTLLTRGLHLDGLADLVDGLASYRDPEGTRAVMRSPEVGPLGTVAVILSLMLQATALAACIGHGRGTASLVLAVATGRLAITSACSQLPAATAEGLGALVAGTVPRWVPFAWGLGLASAAYGYAYLDPDGRGPMPTTAIQSAAAPVVALAVTWVLRRHALRRVGGVTGDVLGALCEVATTMCLLVLALNPQRVAL
jgi:adenosylcobinamide-GDP ribazoletransferase